MKRRWLAALTGLLSVIGPASVHGQAQDPQSDPAGRPIDPRSVAVRISFGLGDRQEQDWSGRVVLDRGEIVATDGWGFHQGDRVTAPGSWEVRTRRTARRASPGPAGALQGTEAAVARVPRQQGGGFGDVFPTGSVIVTLKAADDARLTVRTEQGAFSVALSELTGGRVRRMLDGRVEVQRAPVSRTLVESPEGDDFPAAAVDAQGTTWAAYVAHAPRGEPTQKPLGTRPAAFSAYVPSGGGDQVRLVRFADGRPGTTVAVTGPGLDVWRPAVAVAGDGAVVVAWSENREGNFDLYSRRLDPKSDAWSNPRRLTTDPGSDTDAVLATAPDGSVWIAWQGWRNGRATVFLAPLAEPARAQALSDAAGNAWAPALAIDTGGRCHVAFDTYRAGSYDVHLRTRAVDGTLGPPVAVADSAAFEARPSLATDPRGRVWVAYEERDAEWGKDARNPNEGKGATLYRSSAVRVRVVEGDRRLDAPDPVAGASASESALGGFNSFPRLAIDGQGRVWLAYRHRHSQRNNPVGGAWVEYATSLSGRTWAFPQMLSRSDGPLDHRPALVVPRGGPAAIVYGGDGRLSSAVDAVNGGLCLALLDAGASAPTEPELSAGPAPGSGGRPAEAAGRVHPDEPADIARLRGHRIEAGGKVYRLLRGEFHRHTELSGDGGRDGALEDMWRYAIDCAGLDWIGNGDHDNGNGKEYTWWIIQKTTDLYHSAGRFTPMFTYERSVQFPHGHRNVMFARRGIRTLPRLQAEDGVGVAGGISLDDTRMLYDYLRELGGLCAAHTTGTPFMGTDWRDNDPKVEPIVEIFQGIRDSYEHLGAPRVARNDANAHGGMQPYGMVWNALGLQYRLGFQSSSDHVSTHMSYAVALAEEHSRPAILDAFLRRHCYAATDNILLDVRCGEHLMGDEFAASGPVTLRVLAHGTRPIARVDIIKDFVYVFSTEPHRPRVELTWTDDGPPDPLSWYYVRVLQDDGELAWGSPIWVRRTGSAPAH